MSAVRHVFRFLEGQVDGDGSMKALLGGKGAGLAEMTRLGMPVPAGFTITTEACRHFFAEGESWPEGLHEEIAQALAEVEASTSKGFGDPDNPLLFSVQRRR